MLTWLKSLPVSALAAILSLASGTAAAQHYTQTNLVSDLASQAPVTVDPNLKNPWGLARGAGSPWWVDNEGTGTSSLYDGSGDIIAQLPFVAVPAAGGTGAGEPTGIIFNGSADFDLVAGNAATAAPFIFCTKDGTISGWNPGVDPTTAVIKVNESASGAVFDGLTWASINGAHFLLAANFHSGAVEMFDANFNRVADFGGLTPGNMPDLKPEFIVGPVTGFAPYNVQAVGPNIVVTYAQQNATKTAPVIGAGLGLVVVYDLTGKAVTFLQTGPFLNAPWGVVLAPQDFGTFSHSLIIGNHGDGTIAAFNPANGAFLGNLLDGSGNKIVLGGLWALEMGNSGDAGSPLSLYFATGINGNADGLFGTLTPVAAELNTEDHE